MFNNTRQLLFKLVQGLVFIMPLFFLPWGPNQLGADNFNKSYLLWLAVPLLVLACFISVFNFGKLRFKRTPLDWPIFIFIGAYLLVSLFSVDKFSAFFGQYGALYLPFLNVLALGLLFFFLVKLISREEQALGIIKPLILGYGVILTCGLILVLGLWLRLLSENNILSGLLESGLGTLEDMAVYIAVMDVMLLGIFSSQELKEKLFGQSWQKKTVKILFVLSFLLLFLINFIPAWWCLLVGGLIIIIPKIMRQDPRRLTKYALVIILPIIFLVFDYAVLDSAVLSRRLVNRLQLDRVSTRQIIGATLKDRPLGGLGPETFALAFSRYRDPALNNTSYWYLRFNQGGAHLCMLLITTGMIGFIAYIYLVGVLVFQSAWFGWQEIKSGNKSSGLGLVLPAVIAALVTGQFFFTANTVLMFLFWTAAALVMALINMDKKAVIEITREKAKNKFLLISLAGFTFLVAWLVTDAFAIKYWAAEAYYKKGQTGEAGLVKSVRLNPHRLAYQLALAKFYKNRALTRVPVSTNQDEWILLGNDIMASINMANKAVLGAPYAVAAHEAQGMIYRDLAKYYENGEELAVGSFMEANKLEPTNPVVINELGRLYLDKGQSEKAIDAFLQATELKDGYFDAKFNLAKAYIDDGQEGMALEILNLLSNEIRSAEIYYEQGRAYYNAGRLEQAIDKFTQALSVSPLHANAMYSLALALEGAGDIDESIYYYNKVLDLNPDNLEVQEKIGELENK